MNDNQLIWEAYEDNRHLKNKIFQDRQTKLDITKLGNLKIGDKVKWHTGYQSRVLPAVVTGFVRDNDAVSSANIQVEIKVKDESGEYTTTVFRMHLEK
jgi:hypothetical protein